MRKKERAGTFEVPANPGRRWGWVFAAVWLFYLADPVVDLFNQPHSVVVRVFGVLITVAFAFGYVQTIRYGFARLHGVHGSKWWLAQPLGLYAVALVMAAVVGESSATYVVFATVSAVVFWRPAVAVPVLLASAAWAGYALPALLGIGPLVELTVIVVAVGLLMFAVKYMQRQEVAIRRAKEDMAQLAVDAERARFSRDLHDIVGHSLTAIIVKAELAGKLAERRPEAVGGEVADIERLAREALDDVRHTVAGYREVTLAGELASARAVLDAAGMSATMPHAIDEVPGELRELFGWVVREGVTNVVRHSRASMCRIEVSPTSVEVVDDGRGGKSGSGSGLAGLRERIEAVGGTLRTGPGDGGGFRLSVTVPTAERSP